MYKNNNHRSTDVQENWEYAGISQKFQFQALQLESKES